MITLKFKYNFYNFQNDILTIFEKEVNRGDKKIHIVAPPGSGKTIIGIEVLNRLGGNSLILVPNLTLQKQWKEKIKELFLSENQNIDDIISTTTDEIKQINILTYQSLTQTGESDDFIMEKIIKNWYNDLKEEFNNIDDFKIYIEQLKDNDIEEFSNNIKKYNKNNKTSEIDNIGHILSNKVLNYFKKLKEYKINSIIVDEAHHLTNWWSNCVYYLWEYLDKNFIVGLTATPPFEDSDFYIVDESYSKLLGEVDYYIPQPAVVKSGRLAPYQDLVYFVEPSDNIENILKKHDENLKVFINDNIENINNYIFLYIKESYEDLLKNSNKLVINYLKFLYNYSDFDLSNYIFSDEIGNKLNLEDIAKTIGKYLSNNKIKQINILEIEDVKKIFYNLGYIWRSNNFYKFSTPIDKLLIYSKTKINGIKKILDKEQEVLGDNLKSTIITDFLSENDNEYINCFYLLKELGSQYKDLNPILVSGQGIYKIDENNEFIELDEDIISITKKLSLGVTKLLIGTRGILGEGWDCPELNTLIDLTGIKAYMSVNQVRGRAIRLDLKNKIKVSNIYDIVCIGNGYNGYTDIQRIIDKHKHFYGIDDSGIIIKGVDHIYPNLENIDKNYENINENMLKRIGFREYAYELWGINSKYENKEIFGLYLNIENFGYIIPSISLSILDKIKLYFYKKRINNLNIIKDKFYINIINNFINNFINIISNVLKKYDFIPKNFEYKIIFSEGSGFKLISNYPDEIVIKNFIVHINNIFSIISNHKYILDFQIENITNNINYKKVSFGLIREISRNVEMRSNLINEIDILLNRGLFKTKKVKLFSIKDNNIDIKNYIGKKPFITSKIEKLWI